jgi:hypothetical protein
MGRLLAMGGNEGHSCQRTIDGLPQEQEPERENGEHVRREYVRISCAHTP